MESPERGRRMRILIADSQAVIRMGVRLAVEEQQDMHVVAEACDVESALDAVAASRPDVAVVELELGAAGPARLIRRFARVPGVVLVLLCNASEPGRVDEALAAGVRAIVSKSAPMEHLLNAIRAAKQGPEWSPPRIDARSEEPDAWASLTPRERDVADLVVQGLAYRKVAERLAISDHTVKNHLRRIYDKLDINSRVELAVHNARGTE